MIRRSSAVVMLAALGCNTHNRISAGPTLRVPDADLGGQITGESAHSSGPLAVVAAATVRAGHDATSVGLRGGLELERASPAWSWRATLTAGPAFTDENDATVRFDSRLSLGLVRGFAHRGDAWTGPDSWMTGGVELFANMLGVSNRDILIGLAVTIGWYKPGDLGLAASAPLR